MTSSLLFCVLALAHPAAAHAVTLGQVDDFQDGTVASWVATDTTPVTNVSTGGPAGAGDRYLRTTSGGTFTGQLGASNKVQWAGDYVAAGVTGVEMDLRNFGTVDLEIRVLVFTQTFGDFTSTVAFNLPADSNWHHAVFDLTAGDLTWGGTGSGELFGTLGQNGSLVIRHQAGSPMGWRQSTPIASQLGIDNILAIPEPATLALVALGAAMLRRRCRSFAHVASSRIGGVL